MLPLLPPCTAYIVSNNRLLTQLDIFLNIYSIKKDIKKCSLNQSTDLKSILNGAYRDRTDDLLRAKQALSQLS
jgi:hypothetical protein